jgi:predicted small metal-binding protein
MNPKMLSVKGNDCLRNRTDCFIISKEVRIMAEKFKKIACDPTCGFEVRSHDEGELVNIVKLHAKKFHNMDISDADVRKKIQPA